MTTEIITQFAFAKSANLIEEKDTYFDSWFLDAFDVGSQGIVETQYKPLLRLAAQTLPVSVIRMLSPELGTILDLQKVLLCLDKYLFKEVLVDQFPSKYAESCLQEWQSNSKSASHPVVFDSLQSIPDNYKVSEAMDILIAGADTTASTLTTGFYHILSDPKIKARLVQAIDDAMPEAGSLIPLQSLEKVEFLVCEVIHIVIVKTQIMLLIRYHRRVHITDRYTDCLCEGVNQGRHGGAWSSATGGTRG